MWWNLYDGYLTMWGGVMIMMLFPLLFTILVIVLIMKLIQAKKPSEEDFDSPIKILKDRLAKGEIDEEEFKRKAELLKK